MYIKNIYVYNMMMMGPNRRHPLYCSLLSLSLLLQLLYIAGAAMPCHCRLLLLNQPRVVTSWVGFFFFFWNFTLHIENYVYCRQLRCAQPNNDDNEHNDSILNKNQPTADTKKNVFKWRRNRELTIRHPYDTSAQTTLPKRLVVAWVFAWFA